MRRIVLLPLLCVLLLVSVRVGEADDQAQARKIVDRAIKATGGEERLARIKAMTSEEKGTYYGMGEGMPYTGKYAFAHPNRFRMEIVGVFTVAYNEKAGWTNMGGQLDDMPKEELAEHHEESRAMWLSWLVPLKDEGVTLSLIGKKKVDDRPAVGVRASSKGHRDVELFFDKETGLLAMLRQTVKAEELEGKEVTQETVLRDFKAVDGVQVAMKVLITRDGKKYVESETLKIEFHDKLDESLFEKP
jgi:outer membrane lipoprotein-sorting protein